MAKGNEVVQWIARVVNNVRSGKEPEQTADQVGLMAKWSLVATKLWQIFPGSTVDGVKVTKFSVYPAPRSPGMVMLTVAGTRKKENLITFYTGEPGAELFDAFMQRAAGKELKWKVDTPYEGKGQESDIEALPVLGGR